jgi:hypothetical protein
MNGMTISSVLIDSKTGSFAFILEDSSVTVIPKEQVDLLQTKYGKTWSEFCDVFRQKENER